MLKLNPEFLKAIVLELRRDIPDDPILECHSDGFDSLRDQHIALLTLADQKLHTFPFKNVKPCWFRLYTDASIVKALTFMEKDSVSESLDTIVSILDMALIMAGGLGREQLIHDIFSSLQAACAGDREVSERPAKRRRLPESAHTLPSDEVSIPTIQFPVAQMQNPSLTKFQAFMLEKREPLILNDTLTHWPALEKWKTISYWLEATIHGRRLVPIEIGRSYTDDDWGQKILPFREFLDDYILRTSEVEPHPEKEVQTGYLAQHDLLKQIPSLQGDIAVPDYCYLDAPAPEAGNPVARSKTEREVLRKVSQPSSIPSADMLHPEFEDCDSRSDAGDTDIQRNIWFGPAWSISPLHHDPYHNILCQVVGTKYIRLYSPAHTNALLPRPKNEPAPHTNGIDHLQNATGKLDEGQCLSETIDMSNTSRVDVAAMELSPLEDWDEVYPGISHIPYMDCIIHPGQALYIPVGWWHYVRSCSVGISVSFWW
ncbi:hypothetical protein LTR84_002785 [Exophiala bonariae]|uniref:JmjC domain-containing protein n=1 Tax=Exophiala bonariae TaxID=1690606 RepID=A0AAV9N8K6_9EURO|nr:hypothetical protein LTR84_002785 [Exophiala bonariae]